ncbi:alanine/ornithine racemase family PLP-dependent enzyme [Chengkuizengella axinellae]|uniref:Alanine/ornithine racemase family PLP-dependent enzyme n=1 Tax=Chengkuizengella axinellae TaxID=3064388 RepID=A0ABT9IZV1_9BACL|nr:alanine/ornithine racemase family PLP-dependent enzyme [Chengkuizengella sp. 2205SS18-9]MDP5274857.1 alanine/ornithine racemase family PLP-dependent enzyme [Chengkuizengella sp. 2205SS18-9]
MTQLKWEYYEKNGKRDKAMKPILNMDLMKVKHNTSQIVRLAGQYGISVAGITKGCCGNEEFAKAQIEAGVDFLADSRIENLMKLEHLNIKKMLLRSPKLSETNEVVKYADYSLNSEIKVIRALGNSAARMNEVHSIILMIDVGDLREGIWCEDINDIFHTVESILNIEGVQLEGIGTNLTCFGGIMPTEKNYGMLVTLAEELRRRYNLLLPIVSGGNSSSLQMIYEGRLPKGITHLRINQSVFLGFEIGHGKKLSGWESNIVTLEAEIIEIHKKPSYPRGNRAKMNAFGNIQSFKDKGIRTRVILAIGRQDMDMNGLHPIDPNISVEGASSDHLIIDITDSKHHYRVGQMIKFDVVTYSSIITAMASSFIQQKIV